MVLSTTHLMRILVLIAFLLFTFSSYSQNGSFNRADSLRGHLNQWRSCYDVTFYELHVKVDPEAQAISGSNIISYKAVEDFFRLQIDLYENMTIDKIEQDGRSLNYQRDGNAIFVDFEEKQPKGSLGSLKVTYHGEPKVAVNPPWDGGFVWDKDKNGTPWVAVACEGIGASLWWPNKDHPSDEPDSMSIMVDAPLGLTCVSNGQLMSKRRVPGNYDQWSYFVSYPINNYNVTLNLGDYAFFSDHYEYKDGEKLKLKYFVLNYNLKKAIQQFKQVKDMMSCFEKLYGKYPYLLDGYTLVETPYWGMEHQSAISYGNDYKNNNFGFDFIIVHESSHEYWGNSISYTDHAELWIHEAMATYTDALFVECKYGHDQGQLYLDSLKTMIKNKTPILGPKEVNYKGWKDADMYYKGAWMMHSIRNTIHDDILWFNILEELYQEFKYSNIESKDIIEFINEHAHHNLTHIFNQYLKYPSPPKFVYWIENKGKKSTLHYKWTVDEPDFHMPIRIKVHEKDAYITLHPSSDFQIKTFEIKDLDKIWLDEESFYFIEDHMSAEAFD